MTRRLALGLGAAWALLLLVSLWNRTAALARAVPDLFAPAQRQADVTSGDAEYGRFLAAVAAAVPRDARLLLLVSDPARQDLFMTYRASYGLYPVPHLYVPMGAPPPASTSFSIRVDPALSSAVRSRGLGLAAIFVRGDAARGGVFRLAVRKDGALRFDRVTAPPAPGPRPGAFRASRPWGWPVGLAALEIFGWMLLAGLRFDVWFRGRWATQAALAFLLGTGATAWGMEVAALVHLPWMPPFGFLPLAAACALLVWRRLRPAAAADSPVASVATGWPRTTGLALCGLGIAIAVVAAAVPLSAWSNWDAWAIWFLKVRAFWDARTLPAGFLQDPVYDFSHPDYPPGFPLVQVFLAGWAGGVGETTQRLLSPAFLAAFAAVAAELAAALGAGVWAWPVAAAATLLPKVLEQGGSGYADLPVGAAMTAALLLFVRAGRGEAPLWGAALLCGVAALFKNEGLLLAVGMAGWFAIWAATGKSRPAAAVVALAVLAATAGPWRLAVRGWDLKPTFDVHLGRVLDHAPDGLPLIVRAVSLEAFGPALTVPHLRGDDVPNAAGEWFHHLVDSWLLWWFAFAVALGIGWRALFRAPGRELAALLALQVAGTWTVFLGAQYDLGWLLVTSLDRLLLQSAPLALALAVAAASTALDRPAPEPSGPAQHRDQRQRR